MGWNSYNRFGLGVTAPLIREMADGLKRHRLDEAGYTCVVIDDGWQGSERGPNGELRSDVSAFPGGISSVVTYVKELGLEVGIYSSPNRLTCGGRPGSLGYEGIHAAQFAEWGVTFVKYDYCPTRNKERHLPREKIIERYRVFHNAIERQAAGIRIEVCEKGWTGNVGPADDPALTPIERRRAAFAWCADVGVTWRTTGDITPGWDRIVQILDAQEGLASLSGPNAFNKQDMLEVGNGSLTDAENRAHFSLWCVLNAPLILGNDLRDIPPEVLAIVTNREVIDLNQDLLCRQAEKVAVYGPVEVYAKPLANGDQGVCVFNRGSEGETVTVAWPDLDVPAGCRLRVRDLWAHRDLGIFTDRLSTSVSSHDVVVYRMGEV